MSQNFLSTAFKLCKLLLTNSFHISKSFCTILSVDGGSIKRYMYYPGSLVSDCGEQNERYSHYREAEATTVGDAIVIMIFFLGLTNIVVDATKEFLGLPGVAKKERSLRFNYRRGLCVKANVLDETPGITAVTAFSNTFRCLSLKGKLYFKGMSGITLDEY